MSSDQASQRSPWTAALGGGAWLLAVAIVQPGWAGALFLFAPLVAVPLAVFPPIKPLTRWAMFAAGLLLIAAYFCEPGPLAACWTLPWLLGAAFAAFDRLVHWPKQHDMLGLVMGSYLTVGAGWLTTARLGMRPLGFEDVIVHATAVHFHYAGFVLPALLARLARIDRTWATRLALVGVLSGTPLVAAGITLTVWQIHWLESAATLYLASACWLGAWQQARFAVTLTRLLPKALLLIASAALAAAMVLASLYAAGRLLDALWLDIPFMLRFHGCLQAFGFALPALLAWHTMDAGAMGRAERAEAANAA